MDLDIFYKLTKGYNDKYPFGNDPFKISTRILEEAGEFAKEVNHHEKTGIKIQKYGEPNKKALAKEMKDVIQNVLSLSIYYNVEDELEEIIKSTYEKFKVDGYIKE